MMQLTHDDHSTEFVIKSYQPYRLVINETLYEQSVVITPHSLHMWAPKTFSEIASEHIQQFLSYSPEIVLIGTGPTQKFLDPQTLLPLIEKKIGFEVMNTLSACYTFKILASEGRNVVAGLIV